MLVRSGRSVLRTKEFLCIVTDSCQLKCIGSVIEHVNEFYVHML